MESPLHLLEAAPRFRLLEHSMTLVDDYGEPAAATGIASSDDFDVL
jgi:hypothetical protein